MGGIGQTPQVLRYTVNKRPVRILLECILVLKVLRILVLHVALQVSLFWQFSRHEFDNPRVNRSVACLLSYTRRIGTQIHTSTSQGFFSHTVKTLNGV